MTDSCKFVLAGMPGACRRLFKGVRGGRTLYLQLASPSSAILYVSCDALLALLLNLGLTDACKQLPAWLGVTCQGMAWVFFGMHCTKGL